MLVSSRGYVSIPLSRFPLRTRVVLRSQCCPNAPPLLQGKVAELRAELNSDKKDKNFARKKIALKKIVANMTMSNNDMAALFPDVIQCMMIPTLEIKKMCVCLSIPGEGPSRAVADCGGELCGGR